LGYAGLILIERGWSRSAVWSIRGRYLRLRVVEEVHLPARRHLSALSLFHAGLSYIFFRVLHLLIETGDADEKQHIGLGAYLLYTLNFTTLVSGPIQRYDEFARGPVCSEPIALGTACDRPATGAHRSRLLQGQRAGDACSRGAGRRTCTAMSQPLPPSFKLYAAFKLAVVYPFFLYANFSGYIDIVIALARLMRVRLPENFDRPFSASSFIDFWNRWHITLSTWLKTYVYNPLLVALMRRISSLALQPLLGVFCFFVTFFLIGVWHGRTSEFIIFGLLQGGGVSINKLWQLELATRPRPQGLQGAGEEPAYIAFGRGLTFSWFAFTLFWFWANWKQIDKVFAAMALLNGLACGWQSGCRHGYAWRLWEWLRARTLSIKIAEGPVLTSRYARVVYASALGLAALVITSCSINPPRTSSTRRFNQRRSVLKGPR
jgi:hypothetical protein